ncbi:retrotransposon protein, putative, ty1-copia subclass, partial [Tanacetum coccineum]
EATIILGIKIYRDRSKRLIGLGQNAYMDKILKRYKMDNSKRDHIPMQERLDLNKTQDASTPKENPDELHWTAVKNILKYLINTKDMFLVYGGNPEAKLLVDCYFNARFEIDRGEIKSLTGYLNNIAASEVEMEAVWIKKFISRLGIVPTINKPITMFCDNSAALLIANELGVQMGARHYHRSNLLKVHTGNLLPWNALITAIDYFGYLYPKKHVEKVFSVAYMSSSLLVLVVMIKWSNLSRKVSFRGRMNTGFTNFLISLMATPTIGGSRFYFMVASIVICGLADGLIGGSVIGSTGKLPKEYIQAIFAGTASSGLFC